MRKFATAFAVLGAAVISHPAHARGHHHYRHYSHHYSHHRYVGGRPSAWCGWQMRQWMGVADAAYNLARNWAHWGSPTSPHAGAVVVYPHHVAKITGECSNGGCIMTSGNDGHAVRTRWRKLAGNIGIRE